MRIMGIGVRQRGYAAPDAASSIDILEIGPLLSGGANRSARFLICDHSYPTEIEMQTGGAESRSSPQWLDRRRGLALPARPVADAAHEHVDARVTRVKSFAICNRICTFALEKIY